MDTYAFVFQPQTLADDWSAEVIVTANNTADSDGAGLLVRVSPDTWYFVGQVWDAGLAADAVALRFQTGGMSVVNLAVAEATATLQVRMVKKTNLIYASYRLTGGDPWIDLGHAPIIVDDVDFGLAAWDTADTLNATFDDLKLSGFAHPPIASPLTGSQMGFSDLRLTEDDGATERLIDFTLTDSDADEVADTITFAADTLSSGVWKAYRMYSGNPQASPGAAVSVTASSTTSVTPAFGTTAAVASAGFTWNATTPGDHMVEVSLADSSGADTRAWTVHVLAATPDTPLALTATPADQSVYLGWAGSDLLNVAGYNLYRDAAGPINAQPIPPATAGFADTGRANGVQVCYTVRAVSGSGTESPDSTQACATPVDATTPAAPPAFWAVPGDQSVQLTWYPSWEADLAGYHVYQRLAGIGNLVRITGALEPVATFNVPNLTNETAYEFAATVMDTSGHESPFSPIVSATPEVLPPVAPSNLDATQDNGGIHLTWVASAGRDVASYHVYRSLASGMLYELFVTLPPGTVSHSDTTALEGYTYFYVVSAEASNGAESAMSNELEITRNLVPAPPVGLNADAGNREVLLSWSGNTELDLAGYVIYRANQPGGPYSRLNGAVVADAAFADTTAEVGTALYYVVAAEDDLGAESDVSNEASAAAGEAVVLVVEDEGDLAFADGVGRAIRDAGHFVDRWQATVAGSPGLSDLEAYDAVVWNLGPAAVDTLSADDQSVLGQYLDGGGSLAIFGQDLVYDVGAASPFVTDRLHVAGATVDQGAATASGVLDDPISDSLVFSLTPPFADTTDVLAPDGTAVTVFTDDLGRPVAVRADDLSGARTFFAAFAVEGVSEVAPQNRAELMQRLLAWFSSSTADIFGDGFETGTTAQWSTTTGARGGKMANTERKAMK